MDSTATRSKRYADLGRYTAAEYPHIIVHDSLPVRLQFYVGDRSAQRDSSNAIRTGLNAIGCKL